MDTFKKGRKEKCSLWAEQSNYKQALVKVSSLKENKTKNAAFHKRAFFFSSGRWKGSMALEGSLVLPVFLFFMMTVLLSLEAVRFQSDVQEALYEVGNQYAFEGYQIKEQGEMAPDVGAAIHSYLSSQTYPYLCVAGGEEAVMVQDLSDVCGDGRVELAVSYKLKPFISWIPIGEIRIRDGFVSHGWVGYAGEEKQGDRAEESCVYVTKTGDKYHLSYNCTHLRVQVQSTDFGSILSIRNASGEKYHACSKCKPAEGGLVYFTAGGNSYHSRSDCSALKRTVYMIPFSQAEGYGACSKCGGKQE